MSLRSVIGYISYYFLAFYLPNKEIPVVGKISSRVRSWCFHLMFGQQCARIVNIQRRVYVGFNNRISMGCHSGLGSGSRIQNAHVIIGDNVMCGPNLSVLGGGHRFDRTDIPICQQGALPKSNLHIGDDVWIGGGVTILGNVGSIGSHAIVGACSVVTHDVPEYAIVAGNPAKVIRFRNKQ